MLPSDLRDTVIALLRDAAESALSERRPDYTVGFDVTVSSRQTFGWHRRYAEEVAAREPQARSEYEASLAEYEAAVRAEMAVQLATLRRTGLGRLRIALASRYLPADLRQWAKRQFALALKKRNPWAVAYLVLVLRDVVEWERDQEEVDPSDLERFEASALEQAQAEYVRHHTLDLDAYDGSPSLKALAGKDEPVESTL